MWGRKAHTSDGRTIYAVGDIHGRFDLLERMLDRIAEDWSDTPAEARSSIVFLGDYIDRGPDSYRVIDRLSFVKADPAVRFLMGNHEATMLRFLEDPLVGPRWCEFGGVETLLSYGVRLIPADDDEAGWQRCRDRLMERLPSRHLSFLQSLQLTFEAGDYLFVHAGVRPGRPLDAQSRDDLLWIRDDFLLSTRRLSKIVVHGHTPAPEPVWDQRRIGLDTGAYETGILTAARISGASVRFLVAKD
jgi:serine/threonine protein phosphatase 1